MNKRGWLTLILAVLLLGSAQLAHAGFSFSVGTDDFYLSVGDYDYLPYAYGANPYGPPPRVSFYSMMAQYGNWVYMQPFGQVWQPYAGYGWRPYTYGHWVYTQYGPTWVGYEPWAWAGYHYGNWIWSGHYGWVWIPGYDWHPGRVIWAQGYDTIGWMPAPPYGYDYSRGYLGYVGPTNQFTYYDDDFDRFDDNGYYSYGGPYYDNRYSPLYYNPSYLNISINLWTFIGHDSFGYDNYADHCLRGDYARFALDRRIVRISSRPLQRTTLERVVKQPVREIPVKVKEFDTDKKRIRVIVPEGEEEQIKINANKTVREVIAPAFAEKQKTFKGEKSQNVQSVSKLFNQQNRKPRVEVVSSDDLIRNAKEKVKVREERITQNQKKQEDEVLKIEKQGKVRESKNRPAKQEKDQPHREARDQDTQFERHDSDRKEKENSQKSDERDHEFKNDNRVKNPQQKETRKESELDSPHSNQKDFSHERPDVSKEKDKNKDRDSQFNNRPDSKSKEDNSKKQRELEQQRQKDFEQPKQRNLEQQREDETQQRQQPLNREEQGKKNVEDSLNQGREQVEELKKDNSKDSDSEQTQSSEKNQSDKKKSDKKDKSNKKDKDEPDKEKHRRG